MSVKEIKKDGKLLAKHIPTTSWSEGLSFFSQDDDFSQVGTWGYDKGKRLLPHIHNQTPREVLWTQEVLYIRKGTIKADIYDANEVLVEEIIANEGDTLILLRGGHGYEVLENGTQVLEIKNGPYLGAEADRRRLKNE